MKMEFRCEAGLCFILTEANFHDCRSVQPLIENYVIRRPNYNQHINLDTAYNTEIRNFLNKKGFNVHIPKNKRNSKTPIEPMDDEEITHYNKRIVIEHYFSHLKMFKSIIIRYIRKAIHFESAIAIANATIILNKLQ